MFPFNIEEFREFIDAVAAQSQRNVMHSSILINKHAGAQWKSQTELTVKKPNGADFPVAKVDMGSAAGPSPGTTVAIKRIQMRPDICLPDPHYNHKWVLLESVPVNTPIEVIQQKMEMAALYAYCMPTFHKHKDSFSSFAQYITEFELFSNDVNAIMALNDEDLEDLIKASNLDINPSTYYNKHIQVLEQGLGLGQTPKTSICEMLKSLHQYQNYQGAKTTMPTSSPPDSPSPRARLLKGLQEGATRGAIGATNRKFAKLIIERMGPSAPEFLHTQVGMKLVEGLIPLLVINLVSVPQVGGHIPAKLKAAIEQTADMAWADFAANGASEVMDTLYDIALPLLQEYAAASGESAEELTSEHAAAELSPRVRERQSERNKDL